MKPNMSQTDRLIRLIIAAGIAGFIYFNILNGIVGLIFGILSVVLLITSVIGFCPLYAIFNLSTKKK